MKRRTLEYLMLFTILIAALAFLGLLIGTAISPSRPTQKPVTSATVVDINGDTIKIYTIGGGQMTYFKNLNK